MSSENTPKIVSIFLMILAGLFVFFPYAKMFNDPKNQKSGETIDQNAAEQDTHVDKKKCVNGKRFFSLMSCFAAGMLIALALCHILPEANYMYGQAEKHGGHAVAGAEEAAHAEHDEHDDHDEHEGETHSKEEEEGHGTPVPNIIFVVGFMFVLLLDQVIFK